MVKRVLRLDNLATKFIARRHGLTPARRLGRGTFCAVYEGDSPESVWKLTADDIQRESALFHFNSPWFPKLLEDCGYVGDQDEQPLWLFKTERLQPLRQSPASVRKEARFLMQRFAVNWEAALDQGFAAHSEEFCAQVVALVMDDPTASHYQEAMGQLYNVLTNYPGARLDLQQANLMARGDQLVLNDIVCNAKLL